MNWPQEFLLAVGLVMSSLLYFLPLNYYLSGARLKSALSLFRFSIILSFLSWTLYRALQTAALNNGHVSLLITAIVAFNFVVFYLSLRLNWVQSVHLKDERLMGWIFYSPILMIAVLISTPLISALISTLI